MITFNTNDELDSFYMELDEESSPHDDSYYYSDYDLHMANMFVNDLYDFDDEDDYEDED